MTRLANFVMLAFGWRRALLLLVAGAVSGLSVPPFFILPAFFAGLPILVWSLDGAEIGSGLRRVFGSAFSIGFWFGLGYFLVAIHWVGSAFFVEGGWVPALAPFAVLLLAAVLALFWAFGTSLAHLFWRDTPFRIVVLAAALALAELARGYLFTGFPFDLLGYSLTANEQMMQATALIGVYGLSFVAPLIAATPALIWPAANRSLTRRLTPLFAGLALIAAQLAYGQFRMATTQITPRTDMRVRLVQPNIDQAIKWQAESASFVFDRLISSSEANIGPNSAGLSKITHLIWPESAFPFYLSEHPDALARIARLLPPKTLLITGAPRLDPEDPLQQTAYNSILAIDNNGEIVASYDKTHLVPFGEYLPFSGLLSRLGIRQFVPGDQGWTAGRTRRLMAPPGTPAFLPLICYEAIFSNDLGDAVTNAAFLLNLTNDGWFDGSIGPAQHFHHARLRAVEEGKPMIRLANTGLSAIIDPLGRISTALPPGQVAVVDAVPPNPLPATFYAKFRLWPLAGIIALTFLIAGLAPLLRRRKSSRGKSGT